MAGEPLAGSPRDRSSEFLTPYRFIRPLLFALDAERAHHLTFAAGQFLQRPALLPSVAKLFGGEPEPALSCELLGRSLRSPVGLAAGFDKNAVLLPLLSRIGFGFLEIGSVTHRPSAGNPRPRLFRLPEDRAVINRMGLNNDGPQLILERLRKNRSRSVPVAVNIAKTNDPSLVGDAAIRDMADAYDAMRDAGDWGVLNVSCPNTEDGRTFEAPEALRELLSAINERGRRGPLLVKFSTDTSDEDFLAAVAVCEGAGVDGYVVSNTTNRRQGLSASEELLSKIGRGGLSGNPLQSAAVKRVGLLREQLAGEKPIIGVGGIFSAEDAYRFIRAGSDAVELYTGLVYEGPGLVNRINTGLGRLLRRDGFSSIAEAVGTERR